MGATITFNPTLFRQQFPAFANDTTYPDAMLQMYFDMATCYVSDRNYGFLRNCCRGLALNLLVAHIISLGTAIVAGDPTGTITSATIDKISVTLLAPIAKNGWQFWLNQTPYGQQLLALLSKAGCGGLYIGGRPETAAFRKVYGRT